MSGNKHTTCHLPAAREGNINPFIMVWNMARIRKVFYKEQTAPLFKGINAIIVGLDYRYKEKGKSEHSDKLYDFRFEGKESEYFEESLAKCFSEHIQKDAYFKPDIVAVMPGHKEGYSPHLVELARKFCARFNLNFNETLIKRAKECSRQHDVRQFAEKYNNAVNTMEVAEDLNNKAVLVIDDICTSGMSCLEAMRALKSHNAKRALFLVLGLNHSREEYAEIPEGMSVSEFMLEK